jgi:hypothetical protein
MFKILLFLLFLSPLGWQDTTGASAEPACACDQVANLQKSGGGSGSSSFTWSRNEAATQYKVWYYYEEGNYTSSYYYTTNSSYTFQNLSPGHYTFYFVVVCGSEEAGFVGITDLVSI